MKQFKGKAIYNPSGKAGEYSYWACNFYTGCSNDCEYCYCKKGILSSTWSNAPQLKKCFKNGAHALNLFTAELCKNKEELRKHGLFFSFTTDPLLPDTYGLTWNALSVCATHGVPAMILTKRADQALKLIKHTPKGQEKNIAVGFTLTGCDDLEPGASLNEERIVAMMMLKESGFKTFASIEPIIDIESSLNMIRETRNFCDHYKVGLMSGSVISKDLVHYLVTEVSRIVRPDTTVYIKESITNCDKDMKISNPQFVGRDYNLFNNEL